MFVLFKELWIKYLHGLFGQDQILRSFRHRPNVYMAVLDKIKCLLIQNTLNYSRGG